MGIIDWKNKGFEEAIQWAYDNTNESALTGYSLKSLKSQIGSVDGAFVKHFFSKGNWSNHELLIYINNLIGPCEAYITTWAITEEPAQALIDLMNQGMLTSICALFDKRIQHRSNEAVMMCEDAFTQLAFKPCHAKVMVLMNDTYSVYVVGSANFTKNPRFEQGVIGTERSVCEYYKTWIIDAINE